MKYILLKDYKTKVLLEEWQKNNNIPIDLFKISEHIDVRYDNICCYGDMILSEELINIFETIRNQYGKPIKINSGYRTQSKQDQLTKEGYRTAIISPHVRGYALDIDYNTEDELNQLLSICRNIKGIRIGWKEYKNAGQTFIHVDVAPIAYNVLKDAAMPNAWRIEELEW